MKFAFVYDEAVVFSHKNIALDLIKNFKFYFDDYKTFKFSDELKEIYKFSPDLVFYLHSIKADVHNIQLNDKKNRGRHRKIKTACWLLEDPFNIDETLDVCKFYDIVFTMDDSGIITRKELMYTNIHSLHLYPHTDITVIPEKDKSLESDLLLVGVAFPLRLEIVDQLEDLFSKYNFKVIGWWWEKLKNKKVRDLCINKFLSPLEMSQYINNTKIVIEINRDLSTMNHKNIKPLTPGRCFNAAAAKKFQLIDDTRENLKNIFNKNNEIITYENVEDLKNKIDYYMEHEEERQMIETNAYDRFKKEHTINKRILEIKRVYREYGIEWWKMYMNI